jgi:hypothetical protein
LVNQANLPASQPTTVANGAKRMNATVPTVSPTAGAVGMVGIGP